MGDFGEFLQQYHMHMFGTLHSRYGLNREFTINTSGDDLFKGGALDSDFFDQDFRSAIRRYIAEKHGNEVQFQTEFRVAASRQDLHISFPLIVQEGAMLRKFLRGSSAVTFALNADAQADFMTTKPASISFDLCKDCLFVIEPNVLPEAIAKFDDTVREVCAENVVAGALYDITLPQQRIPVLAGWAARHDFGGDAG